MDDGRGNARYHHRDKIRIMSNNDQKTINGESISKALVQAVNNDPKELEVQIQNTEKSFQLLGEFIKRNLKEGIDYGIIQYKDKYGQQKQTKPFLHKPGAEKFVILFGHRPTFQWINQDFTKGIFAVKCFLLNKRKEVVGEGFGSARVGEKANWTENEAMKMACKRAQIDAALRTYGLSEHFTQDEEVITRTSQPQQQYQPRPVSYTHLTLPTN